jgi:leucyl-tRNA synthetase
MAQPYDPATCETAWQARWAEAGAFRAVDADPRPKKYVLDMFPYPSGDGLHMGHASIYTISDAIARVARARGFNVLHPTGWDAFGLPAEQYAIDHQVHPREAVEKNVATFKRQMQRMGWSIDWDREIDTTDPEYYRWTQWIFLRLFEKGLAYEAEVPVNWCEALGTVLANEEVIDGKSERGGHPVVRRPMKQWMLRITAYADRLLQDLDGLDWPERIKEQQREWIGRSEGAEVTFKVGKTSEFKVFTTRPDTLFGATFCVLAPEHPLVHRITTPDRREVVQAYVARALRRSERDRAADAKVKSGVFTGAYATNPVNGASIPVWVADYVLLGYGTGAVMAVPGHDARDHDFARTMDLPIREVISGGNPAEAAHEGDGTLVGSGFLNGLSVAKAKAEITRWLEQEGHGRGLVHYRLRDWLFARQRYWGEPFPLIKGSDGAVLPVPEADLPVRLPDVKSYKPTGTGESPLAAVPGWVNVKDPRDGMPARRETNTMPQWAGSCWYYLRFADPRNARRFCAPAKERYWMPVDVYVGGAEHAVLHLLYARFWHKVLYDMGYVHTKEPFQRLVNQGMVLAPSYRDGENGPYLKSEEVAASPEGLFVKGHRGRRVVSVVEKMSKSKKNVVNPDAVVAEYGADVARLYLLFMGPTEANKVWDSSGIEGLRRFHARAWRLFLGDDRTEPAPRTPAPAEGEARRALHVAIDGVTRDVDALAFNTAISKLMVLLTALGDLPAVPEEALDAFARMLQPFAPHAAEEFWKSLGRPGFVSHAPWPVADPAALVATELEYGVQVDGKVRGRVSVPAEASDADVLATARALPAVQKHLEGRTVVAERVVKGRLVVLGTKPAGGA